MYGSNEYLVRTARTEMSLLTSSIWPATDATISSASTNVPWPLSLYYRYEHEEEACIAGGAYRMKVCEEVTACPGLVSFEDASSSTSMSSRFNAAGSYSDLSSYRAGKEVNEIILSRRIEIFEKVQVLRREKKLICHVEMYEVILERACRKAPKKCLGDPAH
jgi:hypothetical protein